MAKDDHQHLDKLMFRRLLPSLLFCCEIMEDEGAGKARKRELNLATALEIEEFLSLTNFALSAVERVL